MELPPQLERALEPYPVRVLVTLGAAAGAIVSIAGGYYLIFKLVTLWGAH